MPAIFSAAIIAIVSLRWSFWVPCIVMLFYAWFTVTQRRWIEQQQQQYTRVTTNQESSNNNSSIDSNDEGITTDRKSPDDDGLLRSES